MPSNGVINSIFIMQLTKQQLTDAYEQGLSINTKNGNIKIVAIINDIYGVNHFNSNKVQWWLFEQFGKQEAKIEYPKPKYNGRAVKCDTVEQWQWVNLSLKEKELDLHYFNKANCICISDKNPLFVGKVHNEEHFKHEGYEIISFSDYCKEQGIEEPKWIQGFEVKDGYNDVVMVSDSGNDWYIDILNSVSIDGNFYCTGGEWVYCRLLRKGEIKEIKFID